MIELKINLDNDKCEFSSDYNELIQGAIYKLLSTEPELSNKIHNHGYDYENINYKLYTFSKLEGIYTKEKGSISYEGDVSFSIRTIKDEILYSIAKAIRKSPYILLGRKLFHVRSIELKQLELLDNQYIIKMLTPIEFHSKTDNKEISYTCLDDKFYKLIETNAIRKYKEVNGKDNVADLSFEPIEVSEKSIIKTSFKKTKITASYGIYRITGNKELLNFLYYTGIGRRNTQGFGMFEIIC